MRAAAAFIFLYGPTVCPGGSLTPNGRPRAAAGRGEGVGREPLRPSLLRSVEKSDQAIDELGRLNLFGQVERDFRLRVSDQRILGAQRGFLVVNGGHKILILPSRFA